MVFLLFRRCKTPSQLSVSIILLPTRNVNSTTDAVSIVLHRPDVGFPAVGFHLMSVRIGATAETIKPVGDPNGRG